MSAYSHSKQSIYGSDLSWFIPFPGDWHILKNYQEVLVKIYFEAGLLDLAKSSGYTPTSITSNFRRTHHFLMEVWESLYRFTLSPFLKKKQASQDFLLTACFRYGHKSATLRDPRERNEKHQTAAGRSERKVQCTRDVSRALTTSKN